MNSNRKKKHIIIITYNVDVFTNPTIDLFFKKLLAQNIGIILIAPPQHIQADYSGQVIFIQAPLFVHKFKLFGIRKRLSVLRMYFKLFRNLSSFEKMAVIGIEPLGFVMAGRLNMIWKKRLGYFSFELLFKDEVLDFFKSTGDENYLILKKNEEKYFKKVDFLVIQDEYRCDTICSENNFRPKKIFLIPVAAVPNEKTPTANKLKFKKGLEIPNDKQVIVFSGSLQSWTGMQNLLGKFEEKWDNRFWLLLHSRIELEKGNWFLERINDLRSKGYSISLHNEPFKNLTDLSDFLSQCDFGLVCYLPIKHPYAGKNIKEVGLASGKFSLYMMLGLPVLATKCKSYEALIKEYDFGVLADTMEDIPLKLHLLLDHPELRSVACKKLYWRHLFPDEKINELVDHVQAKQKTL